MHQSLFAVLVVAAVCVAAEPARYRAGRVRFLARQESAVPAPAPTGYPAAGVTPEVPFDLPPATAKPDVTYLPPDNTYGPPPGDDSAAAPEQQPDAVYGPPDATDAPVIDEQPEAATQPALQNQPTDVVDETAEEEGEEILVAVDDDGAVIAVSNAFDQDAAERPARLFFQRFPQGHSGPASGPVPARIIQMRRMAPSKLQLMAQPQSFMYTSRFEQW